MRGLLRLIAMGFIGVFVGVSLSTFMFDNRRSDVTTLPRADAILVLAAGISADGTLPPTTRRRLEAGVAAFEAGKAPRILFSGGRASPAYPATAEVMAEQARAMEVPAGAILVEAQSHSTLQNSLFSREVLDRNGIGPVILVTESYHLGRSLISMSWAGVEVSAPLSAGGVFADGPEQGIQRFAREVLATVFNMVRLVLWYVLGWIGWSDEDRLPVLVDLMAGHHLAA